MREVNLISICQAFHSLNPSLQSEYLSLFGIDHSPDELNDLDSFVQSLRAEKDVPVITNRYFMNYSIPQIGKEFDLLRFGEEEIVNIELKRTSTEEKILKQLKRNQYYLSFLEKRVFSFTYISDTKSLYSLSDDGLLRNATFSELSTILYQQKKLDIPDINRLFNPSNYLVSPFNSTDAFLEGSYFLTVQQEEIKRIVMSSVETESADFYSISGKAGTGKTLLIYDIAKEILINKKVLIIHCGKLNSGHYTLNRHDKWNIIPAKNVTDNLIENFELVIVDETQRIYPSQLELIIADAQRAKVCCVFAYDPNQTLRSWEKTNNIEAKIDNLVKPVKMNLTEKIRTNKEVANFIKGLFNKAKSVQKVKRVNIELSYFLNLDDAKRFMNHQKRDNWKIVNYTPSNRNTHPYESYSISNEDNAHEVIGQEFDKVLAVIDPYFGYTNNFLSIKGYPSTPYYNPVMMLFQAVTRTRKQLNIVIINNPEVMARCLSLVE